MKKNKMIAPIFSDIPLQPAKIEKKKTGRSTRFDKTSPIKYPVTESESKLLRRLFIHYREKVGAGSITEFMTMMVRYGLRNRGVVREFDEYKDTGTYKTVKPNQLEKQLIVDLAIDWDVSERKTIRNIVLSVVEYLHKGGSLIHEEVQPIRPSK